MTVTANTSRDSYNGNGATVEFPVTFRFLDNTHVKAILRDAGGAETLWTEGTHYTLSGAGDAGGGTLTVKTTPTDYTPAAGETLVILRDVSLSQNVDYVENEIFPAETHEQALDKAVMIDQQLNEVLGRTLKFSDGSSEADVNFPDIAGKGGYYPRVTANGAGLELVTGVAEPGNFVQSGAGAVSRSVNSKLAEVVSVYDFGAVGDGETDDTAAILAANDAAESLGKALFFPEGKFVTSASIPYKVPIIGVTQGTNGVNGSQILTTINDGSGVIEIDAVERYRIENLFIREKAGSGGNAVGILVKTGTGHSSRYFMANIYVMNLTTGFDLYGFIGDLQNLWAWGCGTGLKGRTFNANRVNMHTESCTIGMDIRGGGNTFSGVCESNTTGLVLDSGVGNDFTGVYFESNGTHMKIGETTEAQNVTINAGNLNNNDNTAGIILYKVNGFRAINGGIGCPVDVRSGCRNVKIDTKGELVAVTSGFGYAPRFKFADPANMQIENLILNPYARKSLRFGIKRLLPLNTSLSLESTNAFNGGGMRMTGTGVAGNSSVQMDFTPEQIALCLGRKLCVGAWIYIPDLSSFTGSLVPDLTLFWNNSIDTEAAGAGTMVESHKRNGWSFYYRELDISSNPNVDTVRISIFMNNQSGQTADVTDYIIVGGICAALDVGNVQDLMNGHWVNHPGVGHEAGDNIVMHNSGATAPVSSGGDVQSYKIGDRVVNTNPSISGNFVLRERVCTTAGTPGTWIPLYERKNTAIQSSEVSPVIQWMTASGPINSDTEFVQMDNSSTAIAATISAPAPGRKLVIAQIDSGTLGHTVTLTSGTFDGTNATATFNAWAESLVLYGLSNGRFLIVENIGGVVLSA